MQNAVDSMVGNAYLYGRQWITDKVKHSYFNTFYLYLLHTWQKYWLHEIIVFSLIEYLSKLVALNGSNSKPFHVLLFLNIISNNSLQVLYKIFQSVLQIIRQITSRPTIFSDQAWTNKLSSHLKN